MTSNHGSKEDIGTLWHFSVPDAPRSQRAIVRKLRQGCWQYVRPQPVPDDAIVMLIDCDITYYEIPESHGYNLGTIWCVVLLNEATYCVRWSELAKV